MLYSAGYHSVAVLLTLPIGMYLLVAEGMVNYNSTDSCSNCFAGIIQAISGSQPGLNVITEMICG
jgi:hypothetical protein